MRGEGFEPSSLSGPGPKPGASANSATLAVGARCIRRDNSTENADDAEREDGRKTPCGRFGVAVIMTSDAGTSVRGQARARCRDMRSRLGHSRAARRAPAQAGPVSRRPVWGAWPALRRMRHANDVPLTPRRQSLRVLEASIGPDGGTSAGAGTGSPWPGRAPDGARRARRKGADPWPSSFVAKSAASS